MPVNIFTSPLRCCVRSAGFKGFQRFRALVCKSTVILYYVGGDRLKFMPRPYRLEEIVSRVTLMPKNTLAFGETKLLLTEHSLFCIPWRTLAIKEQKQLSQITLLFKSWISCQLHLMLL